MWTERSLMEKLAALFAEGIVISRRGLIAGGYEALIPIVEELGGFSRLRRRARLPRQCERQRGPVLDGPRALVEIRARWEAGAPLTGPGVPERLRTAAARAFGGWRAAIAAAGLRYVEVSAHRTYSDDDLREAVRELARTQPAMSYRELQHHALADTLRVRFGSLRQALVEAGVPDWAVAPPRRRG